MKYELETLESVVQTILNGQSGPETMQTLYGEEKRLPKAITGNIFPLTSDYHIHQYISWHQGSLVKLADQLYRKTGIQNNFEIKKALVVTLNLLASLNRSFPEQFDKNVPLPKILLDRECKRYSRELESFKTLLKAQHINARLVEIALLPITDFIDKKHRTGVTYGDYEYITAYAAAMKELNFEDTDHQSRDWVLSDKLIIINYNSLSMLEYCTSEIIRYRNKYDTRDAQERVLSAARKIVSQLPVITGISYDKRFQPLRKILLKWLDEELAYISGPEGMETNLSQENRIMKLEKIRLPVPQIALFALLLYQNGFYHETDKNRIIDHYIYTYSSKDTEQMSEGSFRNHFNKPKDDAARSLRRLIKKLLDDLDDFLS